MFVGTGSTRFRRARTGQASRGDSFRHVTDALRDRLELAAAGLLFSTESDRPFEFIRLGAREPVESLIERIRSGPPAARVEGIDCEPLEEPIRFHRFEVTG